jgi:hypothetical protein
MWARAHLEILAGEEHEVDGVLHDEEQQAEYDRSRQQATIGPSGPPLIHRILSEQRVRLKAESGPLHVPCQQRDDEWQPNSCNPPSCYKIADTNQFKAGGRGDVVRRLRDEQRSEERSPAKYLPFKLAASPAQQLLFTVPS